MWDKMIPVPTYVVTTTSNNARLLCKFSESSFIENGATMNIPQEKVKEQMKDNKLYVKTPNERSAVFFMLFIHGTGRVICTME